MFVRLDQLLELGTKDVIAGARGCDVCGAFVALQSEGVVKEVVEPLPVICAHPGNPRPVQQRARRGPRDG